MFSRGYRKSTNLDVVLLQELLRVTCGLSPRSGIKVPTYLGMCSILNMLSLIYLV